MRCVSEDRAYLFVLWLIVAWIISGGLASTSSAQQEDTEFKAGGEYRIRYSNYRNATGVPGAKDDFGDLLSRGKLNVSLRRGENIMASATLLHRATLGNSQLEDTSSGTPNAVSGDNVISANRFWGWWKATDRLSFRAGRFGLQVGDGSVFSENEYEQVPTALEGLLTLWDMDFAKLTIFAIKTDEFSQAPSATAGVSSDPEQNLYGVSLDLKNMPDPIKLANVHFIQVVKDQTYTGPVESQPSENAQRIGLAVGGDLSGFQYKVSGAYVFGRRGGLAQSQDMNQSMIDTQVGYHFTEQMGLKVWIGYHMDSGDKSAADEKDQTYDPLFYDRHAFAGEMDIVGWGNLTYAYGGASFMLMEDLELGAAYYLFSKTESGQTGSGPVDAADVSWQSGFTTINAAEDQTDIGNELDVWATKAYEDGITFSARVSMFSPGDALTLFPETATDFRTTDNIWQYWLQAGLTF